MAIVKKSGTLTSWNPVGLIRPVMRQLYCIVILWDMRSVGDRNVVMRRVTVYVNGIYTYIYIHYVYIYMYIYIHYVYIYIHYVYIYKRTLTLLSNYVTARRLWLSSGDTLCMSPGDTLYMSPGDTCICHLVTAIAVLL